MLSLQFLWFAIAGAAGFAVDAGVLQLLVSFCDWSPALARIPSFFLAVATTWWVNRSLTFRGIRSGGVLLEAIRYLIAMSIGALINWGVYLYAIGTVPQFYVFPALALLPATAVAMIWNFLAMKLWIYRKDKV